ncbi:hypothetical protein [Streptococcus pluranimalium]|uniref:Lipoprotein n=1 Tax=Streptococcus pluranimalium TaxID=82348 RepID=A0A2L0D3D5_9STRE|nr:hypothetical protein [Streptococcus pluranimalium]AUW96337.1 hypothetical protein C0J00_04000 [Streptococcus pluranimalium]
MNKKIVKLLIIFSITIILSSCELKNNLVQLSDKLTVTHIHDTIVYGKTTKKQLLKIYGNPDEQTTDQDVISKLYNEDNDIEDGTMEKLDDNTNYFETEKYVKISYSKGNEYDVCYTYTSNKLGLDYVRFYIKDNIVKTSMFGEIIDKQVAKQDKYLRQILD